MRPGKQARALAACLTIVLMLVLGSALAGCGSDAEETEATAEADTASDAESETADAEGVDEDEDGDVDEGDDESADDDEADDISSGPVLGPTDAAVSWAYLKDMYEDDGYWYVTVDYILVEGPEEDLQFVNNNPMLRTFPVASDAELELLISMGSPDYDLVTPAQFDAFQEEPGDELVEVTPTAGWVVGLTQWWSP